MSMLTRFATVGTPLPTYVDDVFSTFLYTGNGTTQTITTNIDTLTNGGTIWFKGRQSLAGGNNNQIIVPDANTSNDLFLDTASTAGTSGTTNLSRTTTGFTLNAAGSVNFNTQTFAAWSFKKQARFFDVLTFTYSSGSPVNHSLGSLPGIVIIKNTGNTNDWQVYHRSFGSVGAATTYVILNSSASSTTATWLTSLSSTQMTFSGMLAGNYVAYLFAHDTSAEGLIQCDSFTTDGSGNATVTSLGWEPQFLMVKASSTTGDWIMLDSMRGWNMTAADARLLANSSGAESTATDYGNPTATGFAFAGGSASATYVYMAIRRANKPPATATDVFNLQASAVNGSSVTGVTSTSAANKVDAVIRAFRAGDAKNFEFFDRVRGFQSTSSTTNDSFTSPRLSSNSTGTEVTTSTDVYQRSGTTFGEDFVAFASATTSTVNYALKRAPKFFDVVCYTGTGAAGNSVSHNLGVKPELAIFKARSAAEDFWYVLTSMGATSFVRTKLNSNDLQSTSGYASLTHITAEPTASSFSLGWQSSTNSANTSGVTYVAYLFASLPGISKIGTYTGNGGTASTNGTSQTINCGFSAGARFVLIKRTDALGDWYVFDSARGIVAASDPYLLMNNTAAEVTTVDAVDADNSGFIVNQTSGTNLNVTSAEYIYLAIA